MRLCSDKLLIKTFFPMQDGPTLLTINILNFSLSLFYLTALQTVQRVVYYSNLSVV